MSVTSRSAAQRWGEARERELLVHGPAQRPKEVPTLETFWPRFLDGYPRANRHKPSGVAAKDTIGRVHLLPALGTRKLDAITTEDVQRLKARLRTKSTKTVNNVLTVLNVALKKAVEWDVIDRVPCTVRLLPIPKPTASFHDFDDYERLVTAAERADANTLLCVLLGGDAGLRCGEMMALTWNDVDLKKRQLCVQHSDWKGHVTTTKGGRLRHVPMTMRLAAALKQHRHLRSERVLCTGDGQPLTQKMVRALVIRRVPASEPGQGRGAHPAAHVLFAPGDARRTRRAIQELAGHMDLSTTQRYMHLSPAAVEAAIRLLDTAPPVPSRGDIVETAQG